MSAELDGVSDGISRDDGESHLALVGHDGGIIAVNAAWRSFATSNGADPASTGVGTNYLQACGVPGADGVDGARTATAIRAAFGGARERVAAVYPCHAPRHRGWFEVRVRGVDDGAAAVVEHVPMSEGSLVELLRDMLLLLRAGEMRRTPLIPEGADLERPELRRLLSRLGQLHDTLSRPVQVRPTVLASLVAGAVARRRDLRDGVLVVAPDHDASCDERVLTPLIVELLTNAIQHGDGEARITMEDAGSGIRLLVDDDGPGIEADWRESVMRPSEDGAGGIRLGLSLARALAEHHGGWLLLEDAPSGGTRVRVEL